ncbi:thiol:disulfide interchange protein DsbA/DsbL [Pigmentiphaga sp.]|uniref:thiol:disulfide interchange protein DsbA/DsbL n=1 Tax=Pigmentiphaga sp. TaxID=1977564 RepID=UPI00128B5838|nr:thiol:disulfide interchange protein DsbA/DsbL [Pigmentiphaga sp.]MPS25252.1 thiol:disulfide interchange protein DsbA/DsbL [Alcaligenaceae bacterium SAGV5]MPS53861.1 thiol:disulfide interchange protein DsbA/DsbL [Alcaligenaceae bacterium SAGV3]MPT56165.1 thiol:disulfide interchange protein DsbA/DsbL [Alcaligenaceae bacterium]
MIGRFSFRHIVASLALAAGFVAALPGTAQAQQPREGTEYIRLQQPQATDSPGKVEVTEFFWYSCPHCNALEPSLEAWIKKLPPDVVVRRVPVRFNAGMEPQQRLYYTLEALGKVDQLHRMVFTAIHEQRQPLNTANRIFDWAEKQGLDRAQFTAAYNSFGVQSKVQRATKLAEAYKIDGVPTLAINGRYLTSPSMTGSNLGALQVADFLIGREKK